MPAPFTHLERVRFGDLDAMRHLNNVVYLRYFESARIAFLRTLIPDHTPDNPERDDFGLIFAEGHINYRSPVTFDEEVAVTCTVDEVRRSAFKVPFQMHVGERLVAEGYGWLVGFDYTQQKSSALPERTEAGADRGGRQARQLVPEDQRDHQPVHTAATIVYRQRPIHKPSHSQSMASHNAPILSPSGMRPNVTVRRSQPPRNPTITPQFAG